MLSKETVLFWNEVEHDLYEENGYIFGVELDLFNNHKNYYCKTVEKSSPYYDAERVYYKYLKGDIYMAIEQFNQLSANN